MDNTEKAHGLPPGYNDENKKDWISQIQPCTGAGGLTSRTTIHDEKFGLSGEGDGEAQIARRKIRRRKDDGPLAICCRWVVQHQIGLSLNLLILLALTHISFPRARRHTRKFFELSYYNEESGQYSAGWDDAWMVLYWIVVFTGLRAAVLEYVLEPLAEMGGITSKTVRTRFGEQGWLMVYYAVFWTFGMYILYNSDYMLNFRNLWTNWPNREISSPQKWYILAQFAFWLQQIMVINIEKRRKDHWQMFAHHIITCTLIFNAYAYHQTKVANLILCAMDVVDLFFPTAKCLKYLGYDTACNVAFALFMMVWVAARHVIFLAVCWSVYHDLPIETNYGCYRGSNSNISGPFSPPDSFQHLLEPFIDPEGVVCFNNQIKWAFLNVLLALQGITIMWFYMICRVAVRVITGTNADDPRSDDEEEEEEEFEEEEESVPFSSTVLTSKSGFQQQSLGSSPQLYSPGNINNNAQFLEEEVGVESINLKSRRRVVSGGGLKKGQVQGSSERSSGVHIPGGIARKELLDRIGCERPID